MKWSRAMVCYRYWRFSKNTPPTNASDVHRCIPTNPQHSWCIIFPTGPLGSKPFAYPLAAA